jgi:hypothetical protein
VICAQLAAGDHDTSPSRVISNSSADRSRKRRGFFALLLQQIFNIARDHEAIHRKQRRRQQII